MTTAEEDKSLRKKLSTALDDIITLKEEIIALKDAFANLTKEFAVFKNDVAWIKKIGGFIALLLLAIFGWLIAQGPPR